MQLSLVAAFIPIVNILWFGGVSANNCSLGKVLLSCGYRGENCVYSALKTCAINGFPTPNECSLTEDLVLEVKNNTNALTVVQTLLQENITNVLTEVKREQENITNTITVLQTLHQEAKSERENITNVLTEVKTLLQVVKSELINVSNFQSEIKTLLQEIKSEGENSSSVVKALLQDMKSERENNSRSLADMKSFLHEMKTEWKAIAVDTAKQNSAIMAILAKTNPRKNCAELRVLLGDEFSGGVQTVYPYGFPDTRQTTVYCDQVTDGGGWTVIQSRSPLPIRENFQRSWTDYVEGFGDLKGEFWLGLDNIHALTNSTQMQLRIDLEDAEGEEAWALYSTFHVGDAASEYVLRIGGYTGDAGDGMTDPSDKYYNLNGMKFSTQDNDNDVHSSWNCAERWKGGWWFNRCSVARLNGLPIVGEAPWSHGIHWYPFRGWSHSMKKATMRIRPVSLGF